MGFNIFKTYPLGFGSLFFTQAFFNFSFYGLKSFFVLYIINRFSLLESEAITLFATLMSLSYAASLIGGWIADKSLGTQNTIILGGILQAAGCFLLFLPAQELCFLALAFICLGAGFFKPNLSTAVGMLFENSKDPQKDKSYSTFYMGMNLGSFLAPLLCGLISKIPGGYYNGLSLLILILIAGSFLSYSAHPSNAQKNSPALMNMMFPKLILGGIGTVSTLFCFYLLFKYHESFAHLMGSIAVASFVYFGKIFYHSNSQERKDLLSIGLYIILFTFFCSLFEQAGSSLLLFFDKAVDRHMMGMEIPSSGFLSLNPIFVLLCSPLLIPVLDRILEKKTKINGFVKISMGFLLTSLSFFILALSCNTHSSLVSPYWVVGALFIQTLGELLIVPIGFSNISKLSPPRFRSVMMSFWFMAIAYGHCFAGVIANFSLGSSTIIEGSLETYHTFFSSLSLLPCSIGLLLLVYYPLQQAKIFLHKIS